MLLSKHIEKTRKTAIYPQEYAVVYPALKLCGEAGEVANEVILNRRTDAYKTTLKKELGDVLWYVAASMYDLNENVYGDELEMFPRTRLHVGDNVETTALRLLILVTQYAETVGKIIRDDNSYFNGKSNQLMALLYDILDLLATVAYKELNITLEEVATANLEKLASRQQRGKLSGSGNNR
jgi:NTP pyrophosphatase (non-canonical NTP hydrolase)